MTNTEKRILEVLLEKAEDLGSDWHHDGVIHLGGLMHDSDEETIGDLLRQYREESK